MISRDLTLTITDTNVSLDKTIILYRYDRGITLNITLKSDNTYDLAKEITKARAIILRPNKKLSATPITDIVKENDKYIYVLYLDDTYTDHLGEIGKYQIQLQLYSDNPNDECITIAPFSFEVKNPIGIPQDSAAYVGQATASNYAVSHAADVPTGDLENGEYLKTNWIDGDLITSGKLNKVETAIDYLVTDSITYAASNDIPSNVSQLNNDAGYLTEHQSLDGYATIDYVDESIANIEVSGGGDVNLKDYVTKENPEMIGTFSLNRDPNFHIGDFSVAMGENTRAEGEASHAEGKETRAGGEASHAEGKETGAEGEASHAEGKDAGAYGVASHAEGESTKAYGNHSHAEGRETVAEGDYSHTEGIGTIAKGKCQHVQGRYNIEDEEDWERFEWEGDHYRYAHIVGNGRNLGERSNAYTLDWKGNAWFAGRAYVGEENSHERKQLATEDFVREEIRNIEVSGGVDLSNYATKEELNNKADSKHEHDQYLTEHQSLKGYATESYVNNVIGNIDALLDAINGEVI